MNIKNIELATFLLLLIALPGVVLVAGVAGAAGRPRFCRAVLSPVATR